MKKLILGSLGLILLASTNLMSADFDKSLYKKIKAGDPLTKYTKITPEMEFDCKIIAIPLADMSKCYLISETESIGTEKDFNLIVSTISDKINTVHLMKSEQNSSLPSTFWNIMFNSGLKAYSSFSTNERMPMKENLKTEMDFFSAKSALESKLLLSQENFILDSVLFETPMKTGEEFDFMKVIETKPKDLIRIVEILESYNVETEQWGYRIDITNFINQAILQKEFLKTVNTEGI